MIFATERQMVAHTSAFSTVSSTAVSALAGARSEVRIANVPWNAHPYDLNPAQQEFTNKGKIAKSLRAAESREFKCDVATIDDRDSFLYVYTQKCYF